jgi:hypothetical protein
VAEAGARAATRGLEVAEAGARAATRGLEVAEAEGARSPLCRVGRGSERSLVPALAAKGESSFSRSAVAVGVAGGRSSFLTEAAGWGAWTEGLAEPSEMARKVGPQSILLRALERAQCPLTLHRSREISSLSLPGC